MCIAMLVLSSGVQAVNQQCHPTPLHQTCSALRGFPPIAPAYPCHPTLHPQPCAVVLARLERVSALQWSITNTGEGAFIRTTRRWFLASQVCVCTCTCACRYERE